MRLTSRAPSRASSRAISLLTADGVMRNARAAGGEAAELDDADEHFHLAGAVDVESGHVEFTSQNDCRLQDILMVFALARLSGAGSSSSIGATHASRLSTPSPPVPSASASPNSSSWACCSRSPPTSASRSRPPGLLISGYALGVVVGAPLLTHRHRRLAAQDRAAGADGDLHARQSRLCARARLLDADGRARPHRASPMAPSSASARWSPPASSRPNKQGLGHRR